MQPLKEINWSNMFLRIGFIHVLSIFAFISIKAQSQNDSIIPDTAKITQIRMWDYRSHNLMESRIKYLGPGFKYKDQIHKITLNAREFEKTLTNCKPCIDALNIKLYKKESSKSIWLTAGGFTVYAVGASLLVSTSLNYSEGTEIMAVTAIGAGIITLFVGSIRMIRKSNTQRSLIKKAITEFNTIHTY